MDLGAGWHRPHRNHHALPHRPRRTPVCLLVVFLLLVLVVVLPLLLVLLLLLLIGRIPLERPPLQIGKAGLHREIKAKAARSCEYCGAGGARKAMRARCVVHRVGLLRLLLLLVLGLLVLGLLLIHPRLLSVLPVTIRCRAALRRERALVVHRIRRRHERVAVPVVHVHASRARQASRRLQLLRGDRGKATSAHVHVGGERRDHLLVRGL